MYINNVINELTSTMYYNEVIHLDGDEVKDVGVFKEENRKTIEEICGDSCCKTVVPSLFWAHFLTSQISGNHRNIFFACL